MSLLKDVSGLKEVPTPKQETVAEESKFGMIKEFNVQSALKTSDQSDAGKSDVVDKANAGGDVSFSLMRNTINSSGEVTGSDVADYIERAEELNDEVDTVPFGLETDDGQIVKVYVNAEQADQFEEAMKNMLGLEDDIEEAINRLTTEFDIVDVVWPKSDGDEDGDGEPDPDADLTIDDASSLDDDDDFADGNYDVVAGGDTPEVEPGSGKVKSTDDDETDSDTGEDGDEPTEDDADPDAEPGDEEEEPDEENGDDDTEDEGDDDTDPDKPKKKKKKKAAPAEPATAAESRVKTGPLLNEVNKQSQENDMTVGSKFLTRVLAEAAPAEDRDGVKDGFNIPLDSQARAMAAKLKLPYAKRLVAFHFMCGVPGRYMNTADVTETISEAADMLRKKVSVRRAFTTLYEGLAAAKGFTIPSDSVNEAQDAKNVVLKLKMPKGTDLDKLRSDEAKEDAIFGIEEGDDSWAQNQTVETIEYISVKGNIVEVGLLWDGQATTKAQAKLQTSLNNWAEDFDASSVSESLQEAKAKRGGFIQKLLESVLVELGLPESLITTTGPSAVGTGIYRTAELIEQDSNMERALRLLASRLGIKGDDAQEPVQESTDAKFTSRAEWLKAAKAHGKVSVRKQTKGGIDIEQAVVGDPENRPQSASIGEWDLKTNSGFLFADAAKRAKRYTKVDEAVDVGNDDFAQAVTSLVSALGIPDDVLERRRTQIVTALRQKKASLRNRGQILTMISRLQDLLSKGTIQKGSQPPADDEAPVRESALQWKRLSALSEAVAAEGSPEQAAKKVYARIKNERELTAKKVKALVKQYDDLTAGQDVADVTSLVIDMLDEKGLLM